MVIDPKEQATIDKLIEVLHYGVGLNDSSVKGTLKIIGRKLFQDIPLGAEAPTFIARKRLILASLYSKRVNSLAELAVSITVLLIFTLMVWATYPAVAWWLVALTLILALWNYSSIKDISQINRLISAIKAQEQMYPDPVAKVPLKRVYDANKHAKQFAKPRLISRFIAIFVIAISAYLMSLYNADAPSELLAFYLFAPFAFMIAVGILLCPINKAETLYLYGVSQIPFKYMPFVFKLCLLLGVISSMTLLIVDIFGLDILS